MIRLLVFAVVLAACGPKSVFVLSADENNRFALDQTLAKRKLPDQPSPVNTARQPRVFAVSGGGKAQAKMITAYDLASSHVMWQTDADVQSRVVVGGDFIVELEGKQLVARDQARGTVRWKADVDGGFVGAAADRERAYLVWKDGNTFWIGAYDGSSGKRMWKVDAPGKLGAPAAQGGLVYVPFLDQWLAIIDGATGEPMTRIRGVDEQIAMLRTTSREVYYGSRLGVFRLDSRSALGSRAQSTYTTVKIPAQLEHPIYGTDAYDVVQQNYTAFDRSHILYAAAPAVVENGPMKLVGDGYAMHYFRYVFGFGGKGELRWAYANPRVELIATEHTGASILGVSTTGEVVALDPATGALRSRKAMGTTGQVLGATFDADGYSPGGADAGAPPETIEALMSIARDHDARFDRVKEYAVSELAKLPGPTVTTELLTVLSDTRAPQHLKNLVVDLLVARKDPASLPVLTQQLELHADYIAKTDNDAVGPIAKTVAGLAGLALDPKQVEAVMVGLLYHLEAPSSGVPELVQLIGALHAIGGGKERARLDSHLLLYRADDELAADPGWCKAIATALADGGPEERELLRQVAADPRTRAPLADAIREAAGTMINQ